MIFYGIKYINNIRPFVKFPVMIILRTIVYIMIYEYKLENKATTI